jgi:hypothetical protein
MKERVGLLGGKNRGTVDPGQAEEQAGQFRQLVEELRSMNKKLRDDPGSTEK